MVAHGVEGWELADYDWNPDTGVARFEYVREKVGSKGVFEILITTREQPADTKHSGWYKQ